MATGYDLGLVTVLGCLASVTKTAESQEDLSWVPRNARLYRLRAGDTPVSVAGKDNYVLMPGAVANKLPVGAPVAVLPASGIYSGLPELSMAERFGGVRVKPGESTYKLARRLGLTRQSVEAALARGANPWAGDAFKNPDALAWYDPGSTVRTVPLYSEFGEDGAPSDKLKRIVSQAIIEDPTNPMDWINIIENRSDGTVDGMIRALDYSDSRGVAGFDSTSAYNSDPGFVESKRPDTFKSVMSMLADAKRTNTSPYNFGWHLDHGKTPVDIAERANRVGGFDVKGGWGGKDFVRAHYRLDGGSPLMAPEKKKTEDAPATDKSASAGSAYAQGFRDALRKMAAMPAFDPSFSVIDGVWRHLTADSRQPGSPGYVYTWLDRQDFPSSLHTSMGDFIGAIKSNRGDFDSPQGEDSMLPPDRGTYDRGGERSLDANPDSTEFMWLRALGNPDGTFSTATSNALQRASNILGNGAIDWPAVDRIVGTSFPDGFLATPAQRAAAARTTANELRATAAMPRPSQEEFDEFEKAQEEEYSRGASGGVEE